jgi:hypothetical protein
MRRFRLPILFFLLLAFVQFLVVAQNTSKLPKSPPRLPVNIPPPPNFGTSSKNGRYQIVNVEYYSQDAKPFLYKRLVKIDTSTGKTWYLHSTGGPRNEKRNWVPFVNESR